MKKIILLFFTFLGICSCFSQDRPLNTETGTVIQKQVTNTLPLKTDSSKIKERSSAHIFPNPAKNKVEIEIKGFEPGYIKIQLVSNSGRVIKQEKRLVLSGNETIVFMFAENAGLYYLVLKQDAQILKSKLVIQ